MWSADIGISWRGGSTKYRKAVVISTPFYFHRLAFSANWIASGARAGCLLLVIREQVVHVGVPSFLYAIIGYLNRDFSTNYGAQG